MKKIFVLLFLVICTSCGTPDATSSTKTYTGQLYNINIPTSWIEMPSNEVETRLPANNFKVFRAGYTISGVYPKLTVFQEKLLTASDSLTYAQNNITKAPLVTQEYTKLDVRDATISGQSTKVHIFQARPSSDSPILTFIQAYIIQDRYTGYTINVTTATSEKNYDKYVGLLTSFQLLKSKE